MINKIKTLFYSYWGKSKSDTLSFFDYSSEEKKRIVQNAAREANQLQLDLIKKYNNLNAL